MNSVLGKDGLVATITKHGVHLQQVVGTKDGTPVLVSHGIIHDCRLPYIYKHGRELRCVDPLEHGDTCIKDDFSEEENDLLAAMVKQLKLPGSDPAKLQEKVRVDLLAHGATINAEAVAMDNHWVGVVELDDGSKHQFALYLGLPLDEVPSVVPDWMKTWANLRKRK
jgi:hypothetical protein